MRVAIVGCCHGELNLMYRRIIESSKNSSPVELILVTGDFQAIRNTQDLSSMSVPKKYLRFGDFKDYFEGVKKAPILTVFIGGNHEASNFMKELYYGGWVCPNIYYLGYSGVINIGGLRIAGLSGIYSSHDYHKGYYEKVPLENPREKKSIYHYRDIEVWKLSQINGPVDIFLSHDWPKDIWEYGDKAAFLKMKPFLKDEIASGSFGSPPLMDLMNRLKPRFWFSSHMHCSFTCQYNSTYFMALDKCVKNRDFCDILDVNPCVNCSNMDVPLEIHVDNQWIDILQHATPFMSNTIKPSGPFPDSYNPRDDRADVHIAPIDYNGDYMQAIYSSYKEFLVKASLKDPFNYQ